MTTYTPFTPSTNSNFQFQLTLDGSLYFIIVNWNLSGQDYYVNLYDTSSNLIISRSLVGSPNGYDITLFPGLFTTSTCVYRDPTGNFEVSP